jgi:hypothetical protein
MLAYALIVAASLLLGEVADGAEVRVETVPGVRTTRVTSSLRDESRSITVEDIPGTMVNRVGLRFRDAPTWVRVERVPGTTVNRFSLSLRAGF